MNNSYISNLNDFNSKPIQEKFDFLMNSFFFWDLANPFISYSQNGLNYNIYELYDDSFVTFEYKEDVYSPINITTSRYITEHIRTFDFDYWIKNINEFNDEITFNNSDADFIIYVNCPFETLIKLVSDFFDEIKFFEEDDDEDYKLKKIPLFEKKWKYQLNEDSVYAYVYAGQTQIAYPGSGKEFRVSNINSFLSNKRTLPLTFPKSLLDHFKQIPNVIEINFSSYFTDFLNEGIELTNMLCQFLSKNSYPAVFHHFTNGYQIIKNKVSDNNNDLFEKLHLYIQDYVSDKTLSSYNDVVIEKYGKELFKISPPAKQFLITGYYLIDILFPSRYSLLDFSPITVELTKVVETEIEYKFWLQFKTFFVNKNFNINELAKDRADKDFSLYINYLDDKNGKIKPPTLGTTSFFLNTAINSKKRASWSILILSFREFLGSLNMDSQNFILSELPAVLNKITTVYRNGSAHTKPLKFETACEYINLLEGDSMNGIINKILKIHP